MDTNSSHPATSAVIKQYGCPVELTLEVIGGKWKCVILWWLLYGSKRFSELMCLIPEISQKVLTEQLRKLEADALIYRQTYQEAPPRVEYSLTPRGETLRSLLEDLCDWGKAQLTQFKAGKLPLSNWRICLIAPSHATRQHLQQELVKQRGARVTEISLAAGLLDAKLTDYDIAIADLSALSQAGADWLPAVQTVGNRETIPIIGLVAHEGDRALGFAYGFTVLLRQPVAAAELVAAIAALTKN